MLANKRILLGITGGIAAYKCAELVRRLVKRGAQVQVVMTDAATRFIPPMTLAALSGRPVRTSLWDEQAELNMGHIELARWADLILIAPATADTLARLATGQCDGLLTTLCLATDRPLAVAPAMNRLMWAHPATQANVQLLRERGVQVVGPAVGELAERESGPGRMVEPADLEGFCAGQFGEGLLAGRQVLITAGPTREPIDPVRFITNRSSGKMGFAMAAACADAGASVTLVAGPVVQPTPPGVTRIDVETAEQMHQATLRAAAGADIFIATAAVADYRPGFSADSKLKKDAATQQLEMVRNPDILADVSQRHASVFCVGFAAETDDLETYARGKLERKGLDMIAANWVGQVDGQSRGFDTDDNALWVAWPGGEQSLGPAPKGVLARDLVALIAERQSADTNTTERTA